jgi:predicted  nucleic acid-binding Zn-ribbon protein
MPDELSEAEYEKQMRRLQANAEDARKALSRAQANFDAICEEMAALRYEWRKQHEGDLR